MGHPNLTVGLQPNGYHYTLYNITSLLGALCAQDQSISTITEMFGHVISET